MWSLRRGIAAAAAGGLRKIPPKLVTHPPASSCWPRFTECNYALSSPGSNSRQNIWKLIADPELLELLKLYDRECGTSRHTFVGSSKFHPKGKLNNRTKANIPIKLDNPTKENIPINLDNPTKANIPIRLDNPTKANIPIKLDSSTKENIPTKLKSSTKANIPIKLDNPTKKNIPIKLDNPTKANIPIKLDSPTKAKIPIKLDNPTKENIPIKLDSSTKANIPMKLDNPTKKNMRMPYSIDKINKIEPKSLRSKRALKKEVQAGSKKSVSPADIPLDKKVSLQRIVNGSHSYATNDKSLRFSKQSYESSEETLKTWATHSELSLSPQEISEQCAEEAMKPEEEVEVQTSFRKSLYSSIHSSNISLYPSLGKEEYEYNPTKSLFNHQFDPIDLVKHRMDFLTSHSQEPYVTKSVWPKIWPKPLKRKQWNVKSERPSLKEPVLIKKGHTRRPCKATSSRSIKGFKYHTIALKNFHICDKNRERRSKRTVASQTEAVPDGFEPCYLCGPLCQADEPSLIGTKKRQDREVLRCYYERMRQREKSSVSDSEKSKRPRGFKESISRYKMRCQLEQCQAALTLCGQLVEARLRLCRIRAPNEGCSGVPEPKQC